MLQPVWLRHGCRRCPAKCARRRQRAGDDDRCQVATAVDKLFAGFPSGAEPVRRIVVTDAERQRFHFAGIVFVGLVKVGLDASVGEDGQRAFVDAIEGDVELVGEVLIRHTRVVFDDKLRVVDDAVADV